MTTIEDDDLLPAAAWWLPEMDHAAGLKDSAYHPRFAQVICQRVLDGETVAAIVADPRMPCRATLYRWLQLHPDFAEAYHDARARMAAGRLQDRAWRLRGRTRIAQMTAAQAGKRWWRRGRPSSYRPAWGRAVCRMLELGLSVGEVAARPRMPSVKVIYTWLKREPAFLAMYVEACRGREMRLGFRIDLLMDELLERPGRYPLVRREVERLQGRMGRLRPKAYKAVPRV